MPTGGLSSSNCQRRMEGDHLHGIKLIIEKIDYSRQGLQREAYILGRKHLRARYTCCWPGRKTRRRTTKMTWLRPCTSKSRFVGPYYLKENLRQLWSQPTRALMQWYLQFWFELALESRITQFIAVAKTSRACAKGILNYCSHEISTG
jgi:transposase